MQIIDKNRPSPAWIAELRRRFPVETEIDRVLTRRLQRRSGPAYAPLALDTLVGGVASLIRASHDGAFTINDARWLSGGASKLQMAFALEWTPPGSSSAEKTPMVLRMEPSESIVETSRLREFQLIKAFEGVVPVPPVFWCDTDGEHLPYPGLVYGFAEGVTKPATSVSGVSGLGTRLLDDLRKKLAPQFVEHLVKIHGLDYRSADLSAFDIPKPGTQCAEWAMNCWERIWEEDFDEDSPVMRIAAGWLRRNLPVLDKPCVVHADYRVGNFLFTEHDSRISAWLDWELGHIGDPHQDLAWITCKAFGQPNENGEFMVNGLMTEKAFFAAYEEASGRKIDPATLHWYKIYNAYMISVLAIATGYRISRNGKTHQDVLVTWLMGIGSMIMDDMGELIEQAA